MHPLLGKSIDICGNRATVGFLRADKDRGIAMVGAKPFLVRLSDASVVREMKPSEDFDAAVLGG